MHRYSECKLCSLHLHRKNVVLFRGKEPVQVLFVGLHPSKPDDVLGAPYTGAVGRVLNNYINDSYELLNSTDSIPLYGITTLIGCFPRDYYCGDYREPKYVEILACLERYNYIVSKYKPKIIVALGKQVEKYLKNSFNEIFTIIEPEIVLKNGGRQMPEYLYHCRKLSEIFKYCKKEFSCH